MSKNLKNNKIKIVNLLFKGMIKNLNIWGNKYLSSLKYLFLNLGTILLN
jgi:hypothetical protein